MVFDGVFDGFSWVNMNCSMGFDGFSWGNIRYSYMQLRNLIEKKHFLDKNMLFQIRTFDDLD